jgi:hypothetical protein
MPTTVAGNYRLVKPEQDLQAVCCAATDLRIAEEMIQHCIETDSELHEICEELEEACWTTALIRYERAFYQRGKLLRLVFGSLSLADQETHHYFNFLRDKLFAHSLGVGEDFEVTAFVRPVHGGGLEIGGVGPRPRRICSPGTDLAKELLSLVQTVRRVVETHRWRLQVEAVARLQAMPIDDVVKGRSFDKPEPLSIDRSSTAFRTYLKRAVGRQGV